jgi:hypothetical protein
LIYTVLKNGALWILSMSHQPQCSLKVCIKECIIH